MSTFVEIAPDEYDEAAFNDFDASVGSFKIGNARALMWMAQLAYETHQPSTIQIVSGKWGFSSAIPFSKSKTGLKGSFETCGIIAERPDAVILAFAGTDPAVWQNLATDFNTLPTPNIDKHAGFELAAGSGGRGGRAGHTDQPAIAKATLHHWPQPRCSASRTCRADGRRRRIAAAGGLHVWYAARGRIKVSGKLRCEPG